VDIDDARTKLSAALSSAQSAGDTSSANALNVLAGVAWYSFVPSDRAEPFRPIAIMDGRRSQVPNDLLAAQVEVLSLVGPDIGHTALRARVNDVCWFLNRKNVKAGLRAIDAYVACVDAVLRGQAQFDFDQRNPASVPACEFLRRATIIARSMGWDRTEFDPLREIIVSVSKRALERDDAWGFVRIGRIDLDNSVREHTEIAAAAEKFTSSASISGDYRAQRALWELAAHGYHKDRDTANEERCQIEAAETYVVEADSHSDSAMVQVAFLNDAIQALRPIPSTTARRHQLHDRLNKVQPRILDEMSPFSYELDIKDLIDSVENTLRGKSLADAICVCLLCEDSPDPEALRIEALENSYGRITTVTSTTVCDCQGRTRFKSSGVSLVGPPDETEIRFLISQHDCSRRQLVVVGKINPIRRTIMEEHSLSVTAIMPIVAASPFVPPGHEYIFAKGALRFFAGDDVESAHLILPQLENSLRHILSLSGVETNRINQDGTQEEAMLWRLLTEFREPLQKLIPARLLQEIDLLFNFRGGPSVRHELAHGKMSDSDFTKPDVTYSIWLVLKMVVLPILEHWDDIAKEIGHQTRS
jgi:hypothetical protein